MSCPANRRANLRPKDRVRRSKNIISSLIRQQPREKIAIAPGQKPEQDHQEKLPRTHQRKRRSHLQEEGRDHSSAFSTQPPAVTVPINKPSLGNIRREETLSQRLDSEAPARRPIPSKILPGATKQSPPEATRNIEKPKHPWSLGFSN